VTDRAAQRALVERYARERPGALLHDPAGPSLLDVASGKTLPLDWGRISHVAEGVNAETRAPFLSLLREDGHQIVLADVGVAFEPLTVSTGPLPGLPPVVCFRDFTATEARLVHYLRDHPEDPVTRSHLDLFFFLIALLDGARAVGFDVAREERRLEALLREIEVRRAPGA
jgi:hypothetical protein